MQINRPFEHLNDDQLLAYLDGEMPNARIRLIRTHLGICWKCRSSLAELEAQVELISRLLLAESTIDADRSALARERFLQWRSAFEAEQKPSTKFLPRQLFSHVMLDPLARMCQIRCCLNWPKELIRFGSETREIQPEYKVKYITLGKLLRLEFRNLAA